MSHCTKKTPSTTPAHQKGQKVFKVCPLFLIDGDGGQPGGSAFAFSRHISAGFHKRMKETSQRYFLPLGSEEIHMKSPFDLFIEIGLIMDRSNVKDLGTFISVDWFVFFCPFWAVVETQHCWLYWRSAGPGADINKWYMIYKSKTILALGAKFQKLSWTVAICE